jgi:hypothetical protein
MRLCKPTPRNEGFDFVIGQLNLQTKALLNVALTEQLYGFYQQDRLWQIVD